MKAGLARFYGWTPLIIDSLGVRKFLMYYKAITVIDAREALLSITVVDFPQMKPEQRRKKYRELNRMAFPNASTKDALESFMKSAPRMSKETLKDNAK